MRRDLFRHGGGYLRMKGEAYVGAGTQRRAGQGRHHDQARHELPPEDREDRVIKRMEDSLKRLQTDYVDVAMVHSIEDLTPLLKNEEVLAAYDQLKKAGKVRFTGFSTHNAKVTLQAGLGDGFPPGRPGHVQPHGGPGDRAPGQGRPGQGHRHRGHEDLRRRPAREPQGHGRPEDELPAGGHPLGLEQPRLRHLHPDHEPAIPMSRNTWPPPASLSTARPSD